MQPTTVVQAGGLYQDITVGHNLPLLLPLLLPRLLPLLRPLLLPLLLLPAFPSGSVKAVAFGLSPCCLTRPLRSGSRNALCCAFTWCFSKPLRDGAILAVASMLN